MTTNVPVKPQPFCRGTLIDPYFYLQLKLHSVYEHELKYFACTF